MKVYISGKIGEEVISDATRQKFSRAEEMLRAKGYEVFNPCDEKWENLLKGEYATDRLFKSRFLDGTFPDFYTYVLLRDQMVLSTKDAVYFLEDWDKSPGACSEYSFAMATSKKMFFQSKDDALDYLELAISDSVLAEMMKTGKLVIPEKEQIRHIANKFSSIWLPL